MKTILSASCSVLLLAASSLTSQAQLLWTVGLKDGGWPLGDGGGANTSFVQENGSINALPGSFISTEDPRGADNDYYFAGLYTTTIASIIASYGDYAPVGEVTVNEEAAERAFAAADNDLRYHFNLPNTLQPTDLLSVTFSAINLHTDGQSDPRYGAEVYFNGVLVQPQIVIRPPQLGVDYTTPQFTLASVNAQVGPGFDNIVSLKGINYNNEGGGNWMGIDYIQLNAPTQPIPPPVFPWAVGLDDNAQPMGDGGGPNASFVQENGVINPLPGSPTSPEVNRLADNDYYFAGNYTTVISSVVARYGTYTPVGLVSTNEEAAERAFAGDDNDLRYHFNLPNTMAPSDRVAVSFDALSLDDPSAVNTDPRYGVEIYFNGVLVQPQIVIRPAQLGQTFTTPAFTLGSVNAAVGSGADNIVSLRGISYSASGGGEWMGIDYVQLNPGTNSIPPPVLPWSVGLNDDGWPVGDGGGTNATFVAENGLGNPLPGSPIDEEFDGAADDDYYFAGAYTTVIPSNGAYVPAGLVPVNEEAVARGFSGADNNLRYHCNLPTTLSSNDLLSVTFDALNLDTAGQADPRYGVEVYFNGVLVQTQIVIRPAQLGQAISTPRFTAASVNAQVGPGFDNIVALKGINYSATGGGNSMGLDYIQLTPFPRVTFPWAVGRKDRGWPFGDGGGPNTSFVQENGGINALPGRPNNPEVNQQGDNDYYFAGEYSTVVDSVVALYGPYTPVGLVLANEEGAERAFAAADNDLRYHFNLPNTLLPDDMLSVTYDAINLHTDGQADPRYGIEVYFNGVLVQTQIVIRPLQLNKDYSTPPFTLASVNAQVGPGYDNIVSLKGINYNADGGGNWMGIDYVQLNPVMPSSFPWAVGRDDNDWPLGDGGGANASFVQENSTDNALPGSYLSTEVPQGADNDYYFAGDYTTAIASVIARYGVYEPVGFVPFNEEAAERAFAGANNDLRYHFNLPATLLPSDLLSVTFDTLNLDDPSAVNTDPRYGVEVYFNGVLVQSEILIRPAELDVDYTTPSFTLASVNAQVGPGFDNIVTLKGISYSASGGGEWMGIDYVQLNPVPLQFLPPLVDSGQLTLNWTGAGQLEWAPTILGPWNPITPPPGTTTYSEPIVPGQNRFFRLKKL